MAIIVTKTVISLLEGRELLVIDNHIDQKCNLLSIKYRRLTYESRERKKASHFEQ